MNLREINEGMGETGSFSRKAYKPFPAASCCKPRSRLHTATRRDGLKNEAIARVDVASSLALDPPADRTGNGLEGKLASIRSAVGYAYGTKDGVARVHGQCVRSHEGIALRRKVTSTPDATPTSRGAPRIVLKDAPYARGSATCRTRSAPSKNDERRDSQRIPRAAAVPEAIGTANRSLW